MTLTTEFTEWCKAQKLEHEGGDFLPKSAAQLIDELDYARTSTDDAMEIGTMTLQIRWLHDFLDRWDRQ